jgi:hypothetical protein
MNNKQKELLDEAYYTYNKEIIRQREIQKEEVNRLRSQGKRLRVILIELLTQEEFINTCKTNAEFSKHWGLKIEERELSLEERNKWSWDNWGITCEMESVLDEQEVPTKQITITYKDKTIESYI